MKGTDAAPSDARAPRVIEHGAGGGPVSGALLAQARTAARRAASQGHPVIAWTTVAVGFLDPVRVFGWAASAGHDPMLWMRPHDGEVLVGVGRAWEFSGAGPSRFTEARDAWRALAGSAVTEGGNGPVLMGGFAFAAEGPQDVRWQGFGAASLMLPRLLIAVGDSGAAATLCLVARPHHGAQRVEEEVASTLGLLGAAVRSGDGYTGSGWPSLGSRAEIAVDRAGWVSEELNPAGRWKALVARTAQAVRRGEFAKVVVARALSVRGVGFDPAQTLARLRAGYPTCALFGVARGGRCFVGATPERLARVRGDTVTAMALAGSAPRGTSEEEDRRLGEALLASAKDRIEHAVVVDVVRASLDGVCTDLSIPSAPTLLKVSNVQHLHTPIAARLHKGSTLLDLVDRLHPTPAVGGVPREDALDWLRRHEDLDRGWYAGPIGWMDHRGDGEFAVAIRSALLSGDEAVLFAGCGIVADSDPEAEYEESRLKLRPMLSALGANGET